MNAHARDISETPVEPVTDALPTARTRSEAGRQPGMPDEARKVRLSLDVTPELNRLIERIAGATGATKSEAIRKAIVLMDVAVEAREQGDRLFVGKVPPPGSSREIVGL